MTFAIQAFSVVVNNTFRKHFKLDSSARNTMLGYMHKLTKPVELKIRCVLPDKFVVVFNGWYCGTKRYLGVF